MRSCAATAFQSMSWVGKYRQPSVYGLSRVQRGQFPRSPGRTISMWVRVHLQTCGLAIAIMTMAVVNTDVTAVICAEDGNSRHRSRHPSVSRSGLAGGEGAGNLISGAIVPTTSRYW